MATANDIALLLQGLTGDYFLREVLPCYILAFIFGAIAMRWLRRYY